MKQIQIDETLFYDILRYVVTIDEGQKIPTELHNRVIDGLADKCKKISDRELYTTYKTAKSEEEKEQARQAYLYSKGIPESFRW